MRWKITITGAIVVLLSGCSFGMHVDRLKEGTEIQNSLRTVRYYDNVTKAGRGYGTALGRPVQQQERESEVDASPRLGWDRNWIK